MMDEFGWWIHTLLHYTLGTYYLQYTSSIPSEGPGRVAYGIHDAFTGTLATGWDGTGRG